MKKQTLKKVKIRKDDKVTIISGKEKGKTGKVLRVFPETQRALVSGINFSKRHVRPTRDLPQGGIIEKESSINVSNLMVVCGKCGKGVRLGIKRLPDGTRMRYCKKCELEV